MLTITGLALVYILDVFIRLIDYNRLLATFKSIPKIG